MIKSYLETRNTTSLVFMIIHKGFKLVKYILNGHCSVAMYARKYW